MRRQRTLPLATAAALSTALLLAACDGYDGVALPADDASTAPDASLQGLYDAGADIAGVGRDVVFARIDDTGRFVEYDWQGDDVDRGADCHVVRVSSLTRSGDEHVIDDGTDGARFTLRPVSGGLEVSFPDATDLDGDGDTGERLSTVLERVEDRDELDMNWCA